ncbi:protein kinase [Legionella sp. W05-934-2]|uniref:protein kinase domain-containing protein n=1 Tax=Legionella sp. W05-934-2 TaxID=1198649 RepID=UPI003462D365
MKTKIAYSPDYSTTTYFVSNPNSFSIVKVIKATDSQALQVKREIDCLQDHGLLIQTHEEPTSGYRGSAFSKKPLTKQFTIEIQYIDGVNLDQFVQDNPNLSPEQWACLIYHMLVAIDNFHQHGWAHRDVKPDNFLLTKQGIVVIDFGHAVKQLDAKDCYGIGNLSFAAPEALSEENAVNDQQSDFHALGKSILMMLGCFAPSPYQSPPLDFMHDIPEKLAKLPFDTKQQALILHLLEGLCLPKHGERITPKDASEQLKVHSTTIEDLSWLDQKTIQFNPLHRKYASQSASTMGEENCVSPFSLFEPSRNKGNAEKPFSNGSVEKKSFSLTGI